MPTLTCVTQQLDADKHRVAGHCSNFRLLPGNFMLIQQAMGLPKNRGEGADIYLRTFVEAMKISGFVTDALARYGIQGVSLAPVAGKEGG